MLNLGVQELRGISLVKLEPLTVSSVSTNYIDAMKNKDLLKYTEARGVDWDKKSIMQFVEQNLESDSSELLGIFQGEKHVGNIRLHSFSERNKSCEIGILIFSATSHGHGLGTAAVMAACDYAIEIWGVTRIMADYFLENTASERMFEKAGFHKEGLFIKHFINMDETFSHSVRVAKNIGSRGSFN